MDDVETLSHATWECKYHLVFIRVLPASMHESGGHPSYGHEQEDGSWHDRERMRHHAA